MKSKKMIVVSHCVLNQNAVVEGWARAKGAFSIAETLIKENIGIIQLPCPELIYNGVGRPPQEYKDYDTAEYRGLCRGLLNPYIKQIKDYISNDYALLGVVGIHKSPTCSITGGRGVLMEELFAALEKEGVSLPFAEIPESYCEDRDNTQMNETILNLLRRQK